MATKLTEKFVKALPIPTDRPVVYFDGGHDEKVPGFALRVTPGGAKSFVLDYRIHGRQRRLTIGSLGTWTVASARAEASDLRRLVDQGQDPMAQRTADRAAPLMSELFDRYLSEHAAVHKKLRSIGEDRSLIHGGKKDPPKKPHNGVLSKFFGKMQVQAVQPEDVMRFHIGLQSTPYRANRAIALLSKAFNLAESWRLRPLNSNPCRHLQKYREEKRTRYLSPDELGQLGAALDQSDEAPSTIAALKALLMTGCRVTELLNLRWADVDMKNGTAKIVDAKSGARELQLSTAAQVIFSELQPESDYVFGGLSYGALSKAWQRIRIEAKLEEVRIHDLRHTTGTYAGAAGYNAFLVRDLLGHKTLAMTGRYVERHSEPVRSATNAISDQISAAMKGTRAEVVGLSPRGAKS